MISLDNLNDQQNHLLTQLSNQSHRLKIFENQTLGRIYSSFTDKELADNNNKFVQTIKQMVEADLGEICIKETGNDHATGFGAIAFEDSHGNTGISFRGTDGTPSAESMNDWIDNITAAVAGTSVQTKQAEAFFDKNRNANGNNFIYGHSKGGQLSESVYVNNYNKVKAVHLLNPQPLNPYSLTADQLAAIKSDKVDIVIVEGDYVWFLGRLPSYSNMRVMKNTGNADPHIYNSERYVNGAIVSGSHAWWEYAKYFGISKMSTGVQFVGGNLGFVYNCVVRIVDDINNDWVPRAQEFIEAVTNHFEKINEAWVEFSTELHAFLQTTIGNAVEWTKYTFNPGYKQASDNPQFTVNTATMRSYADRLTTVNKRIIDLDRRMDALYKKVGLRDLLRLLQADLMTGYNWRIKNCARYLNETANDFDATERNIAKQF